MALHLNTNNFNGGEVSPLVYGRQDLQKYGTSAKVLENFVPLKYGPIERSLGFECVFDSAGTPAVVETKGNAKCKLKDFRFNSSTNYVLAFTDQEIRVYKGGATATQIESSAGVAWQLSDDKTAGVNSPYLEADLFDIQFRQINDVMYITHPSYLVHKLSRLGETDWVLTVVDWDFPPMLDANTSTTTMAYAGTLAAGNTGTLTASTSYFDDDMVGGYFSVTHRRDGFEDEEAIDGVAAGGAVSVKGAWTFSTVGAWTATINLERRVSTSDPWEIIRQVTSVNDANYTISGTEPGDGVQYRINIPAWTSHTAGYARLQVDGIDVTGVLKIDSVDTTGTIMNVTVKKTLESTDASTLWSEGAFSTHRGHPRTCSFHQQRLWFGGTTNEKQRIWGSQTADFENFERSTDDDGSIAADLASDEQNEIMWMVSQRNILVGTSANEWTVGSDSLNGAITPSNITARLHTSEGSSNIAAQVAGNKALFFTRNTARLQDFFYNFQIDGYDSDEISKLSEHILGDGITQMAYQQIRDQIVWMVRSDGELVCLVYNQEDNVLAFFRRQNDSITFESVATTYGVSEDEVWVVAKATIDSTVKRFICRVAARTTTKEDMVFLDLADTQTGASSTTWTFPHLLNETVDVLADGWVQQGIVADGSGVITLSKAATKVTAGLPYTSTYRSLNIEGSTGDGNSKGKKKRISRIDLGLKDSLGGKYGIITGGTQTNSDIETTYLNLTRIMGQSLMGSSPTLQTGVFPLTMPAGHHEEIDVVLKQDQPLPMTITHTFPVVSIKGD